MLLGRAGPSSHFAADAARKPQPGETETQEQLPDPLGKESAMPGGQLSQNEGGRGSQWGIIRKGWVETVSRGAGSLPYPLAWLHVVPGVHSAGFEP